MAIKRCPYCKAIIDENAQYCANCGTQLLFPEDEEIEEPIPGERIVDDEQGEAEKPEAVEKGEKTPEEAGWKKTLASDESREEEEADEEADKTEELEKLVGKKIEDATDEEEKFKTEMGIDQEEESKRGGKVPEEHIEEIGEVGEKAFDTADLDKIEATGKLDNKEVEGILSDYRDKEKDDTGLEEKPPEETELPPWIEQIKEAPPSDTYPKAEGKEDKEIFSPESEPEVPAQPDEKEVEEPVPLQEKEEVLEEVVREEKKAPEEPVYDEEKAVVDAEVGIPEEEEEEEEQKGLPFEEEDEEYEEDIVDTRDFEHRPSRISPRLKARIFDVSLITLLWLITVWYASRLIEASLASLISASALPVFGLFLILIVCYFFMFLFFLGKTLGDRLFRRES